MSKKIILFNTLRRINQFGGMERVMCDLANYLDSKGFDITIVHCDENNNKPAYELSNEVKLVNIYCPDNKVLWNKLKCLSISQYKRHCKRACMHAKELACELKKKI